MHDPNVLERMRADWNARAREDAHYYVAFGRREQGEEEFYATASDVVRNLEAELKRLAGRAAALEIGCGPGRLMRPMSRHFEEIHGVDVSDEMIGLARQRLRDLPNAQAHATTGSDLARFAAGSFDFVYSYAVFQHIPAAEVVFQYLLEARRVLKTGGILRCQINGLPPAAARYTTWEGVRISAAEVAGFAREHDLQLLALEGAGTQYMWVTCRKQPAGWTQSLAPGKQARITRVRNAYTDETAVPTSGPLAVAAICLEDMPPDCDLNNLEVEVEGRSCRPVYLGDRAANGISQLNAVLPAGLRTGLATVNIRWLRAPLAPEAWVRLIPAGPLVPRVCSVADGINLLSTCRTESGFLKVTATEVGDPRGFHATLNGCVVRGLEWFCVDPLFSRYEFNFRLPEGVGAGTHVLRMTLGARDLGCCHVEVI